jgi:glycosyltransferase involved in cell wall biosynthesis
MKLSIIIPCYNELHTIVPIIEAVRAVDYPDKEIIVVDDYSTDGTRDRLKHDGEPLVAEVIYHDRNQGKGAALRTGFSHATGDIVIVQDADLEYDPQEILVVIQPILDGKADVVYGSRFMGASAHRVLFFWHMMGNKFLTFLSNMHRHGNLLQGLSERGYPGSSDRGEPVRVRAGDHGEGREDERSNL